MSADVRPEFNDSQGAQIEEPRQEFTPALQRDEFVAPPVEHSPAPEWSAPPEPPTHAFEEREPRESRESHESQVAAADHEPRESHGAAGDDEPVGPKGPSGDERQAS